jgi:hypothetical protein
MAHGDFCQQVRDTEIVQSFTIAKPTDMTIHWKTREEHFLMASFFFMQTIKGANAVLFFLQNLSH